MPSEDEESEGEDDNLMGESADIHRSRKHESSTLPDKGQEAVDVNHEQATESSEDDDGSLVQENVEDNFDWEDENNFIALDNDVNINSEQEDSDDEEDSE